jgi:hypothetical protein
MFEVMFSDLTFGIWASETPPRSAQRVVYDALCQMPNGGEAGSQAGLTGRKPQ